MPVAPRRPGAPRRRHLAGALLALALAAGVPTASAAPGVVWTNFNAIGRADLDGANAEQDFIAGQTYPRGIAADDDFVYWSSNGTNRISRARRDGTGVQADFITGADGPSGLAIDATHVYWVNTGDGTIGRADLDGTDATQAFISTGRYSISGLAVSGTHVYWTDCNFQAIGRAALDGTGADLAFISTGTASLGVAVDGGHVYWGSSISGVRSIGRAALDGTGVSPGFIPLTSPVNYLATDGTHVYWADYTANRVGRAGADGTDVDEDFIPGAPGPTGVAVVLTDPVAVLAPAAGAFADRAVGTTSAGRGFTVTNTGTGRLTPGSAALTGTDPAQFAVVADTCSGRVLPAGSACTVEIAFGPSSAGAKSAVLTVPGNGRTSPVVAGLSGTATAPAVPPVTTPAPVTAPAPAPAPDAGQSPTALAVAGVTVAVSGPGTLASTVRATIDGRTVTIPAAEAAVAAAGAVRVRLVLPARVRARLAAAGRVRISVTSVLTGPDGGRTTASLATIMRAPSSRVLPGHWIARVLGPWEHVPAMGAATRAALRFTTGGTLRSVRVVR